MCSKLINCLLCATIYVLLLQPTNSLATVEQESKSSQKASKSQSTDKRERAALYSEPRLFPFIEAMFEPSNPNVPYQIPSYPNKLLNSGPTTHGSYATSFPLSPKPDCATNGHFCPYDSAYPSDKVNVIIDRYYNEVRHLYTTLNRVPSNDLLRYENNTYDHLKGGRYICDTRIQHIRPGWARNVRGEWLAVINSDIFPQVVRIEECKYSERRCEYLPPCYNSKCVQKFSYEKLMCVDPLRTSDKPFVDIFEIPSACSCFVENFTYY